MLRYEMEEDDVDNARTRILSIDEETALRNVLSDAKRNAEIWNLLVTVAIETGARVGEIVLIEPSQLNDSLTVLHIPKEHTKAHKERYVPLSTKAQITFRRLVEIHETKMKECPDSETRLFRAFSSADSISQAFKKKVKKSQLVDFKFHDLRHTAITRMVLFKRELRISDIMVFTGHESLEMHRRYSNVRADELVQFMK